KINFKITNMKNKSVQKNNMHEEKIEILMNWIRNNRIFVHSSIALSKQDDKVPKNVILSPKTSKLSYILSNSKIPDILNLCIAYMYEKNLGQKSLWYGYLQIMPEKVDIPKLWDDEKNWLKGTEIEYIGGLDITELHQAYENLIRPFIKENKKILDPNIFTYNNFLKAISVVRSRAFEIDNFHGLGLVPFADMFNHTSTKEHIHFQTFYEVCSSCGSAYCCNTEHLQKNSYINSSINYIKNQLSKTNNYKKNELFYDTCDMVIYNSPSSLDEIFNTYGSHGNDVLLSRYGFSIPQNKWDRITMSKTIEKKYIKSDRLSWWKLHGFNISYQMNFFQKYFSNDDIKNYINQCNSNHNYTDVCSCQKNKYLFLQDSLFLAFPSIPSQSLIFFITLLSLNNKLFEKLKKNIKNTIAFILNIIKLQTFFFSTGSIKKFKYQKHITLLIIFKINKILLNSINNRLKKYNQTLNLDFIYENTETQIKNYRKKWTKIVLQNELNILNNTQKKCINIINITKSILKQKKLYLLKNI
ncbi:hypothetical protein PORY_002613, partial [Pneumocystis oryctolagi]